MQLTKEKMGKAIPSHKKQKEILKEKEKIRQQQLQQHQREQRNEKKPKKKREIKRVRVRRSFLFPIPQAPVIQVQEQQEQIEDFFQEQSDKSMNCQSLRQGENQINIVKSISISTVSPIKINQSNNQENTAERLFSIRNMADPFVTSQDSINKGFLRTASKQRNLYEVQELIQQEFEQDEETNCQKEQKPINAEDQNHFSYEEYKIQIQADNQGISNQEEEKNISDQNDQGLMEQSTNFLNESDRLKEEKEVKKIKMKKTKKIKVKKKKAVKKMEQ